MGVHIVDYTGTGRAKCKGCNNIIPKSEQAIKIVGFQISSCYCKRCILKIAFGIDGKDRQDKALVLLELDK